jgi:hypothetical protein
MVSTGKSFTDLMLCMLALKEHFEVSVSLIMQAVKHFQQNSGMK